MASKQDIAIVGGGISGLVLAYRLSSQYKVTIFEKGKTAGGLTISFKKKNWQWPLENFYHHFFPSDRDTIRLLKELRLNYFFLRPKTSIYQNGQIHQFDSITSLLAYPHLNIYQKLHFGIAMIFLKILPNEKLLEGKLAVDIFPKLMGRKAYQIIVEPLLRGKFGRQMGEISAVWLWARFKKRSSKLGYIEGGHQQLINRLIARIRANRGIIRTNSPIQNLSQLKDFSKIIVAASPRSFLKIAPGLPKAYQHQLSSIKTLAALNLVLITKRPLLTDGTYWLNINDPSFPFVALVQHTNFISPRFYGNNHILYIGGYYPQSHPYLTMDKEKILKKFWPYLQKVNPRFHRSSIIDYRLSKAPYAQPIATTRQREIIPSHQTPIDNVYLICMEQIYPWDRGINYTIKAADKLARRLHNSS